MKEAESIIKKCDVALFSYQRQLNKGKEHILKVIEDYKASDAFHDEVMEASEGALDYGFLSCRSFIIKPFFDLDLSKTTMEAALTIAFEVTSGATFEVHTTVPPTAPFANVPPVEVPASSVKVSIVEVIPVELADKNPISAPLANVPQANT